MSKANYGININDFNLISEKIKGLIETENIEFKKSLLYEIMTNLDEDCFDKNGVISLRTLLEKEIDTFSKNNESEFKDDIGIFLSYLKICFQNKALN